MKLSARQIVKKYTQNRVVEDPGFYAGYGNDHRNINSENLEQIYAGIAEQHGARAAQAFVDMIAGLTTDASAATILTALYRLEEANWKHAKRDTPTEADTFAEMAWKADLEGHAGYRDAVQKVIELKALGMPSMSDLGTGDSVDRITGDFLRNHGAAKKPEAGAHTKRAAERRGRPFEIE